MKKTLSLMLLSLIVFFAQIASAQGQTKPVKAVKYDTIIRKHVDKPAVKPVAKPVEIILPTPEYINQPNYYDKDDNRLIKLESAGMIYRKENSWTKRSQTTLSMEAASSGPFYCKKGYCLFIKTSDDIIDLTSYIKLYRFVPGDQKRELLSMLKRAC